MNEREESQQRVALYESLFEHPGWKLFIADAEGWKAAISQGWRALTATNLPFEQGRYAGLEQVTTFENLIASIKAEEADDFETL